MQYDQLSEWKEEGGREEERGECSRWLAGREREREREEAKAMHAVGRVVASLPVAGEREDQRKQMAGSLNDLH